MRCQTFLLTCFLLLSGKAICQEKYIEVTVSDTAWIEPNQYVYTFSSLPVINDIPDTTETTTQGIRLKMAAAYNQQKQSVDSFKNVLIKKGFTILPQPITESYTVKEFESLPLSFRVITSSADSVKMLYDYIKDGSKFYGGVVAHTSTTEEAYKQILNKRIISAARKKAIDLAGLSGLKLGGILAVKEQPLPQTGWTAYPPLSGLNEDWASSVIPGWHTTIYPRRYYSAEVTGQYKIENTLVVRFAAQ